MNQLPFFFKLAASLTIAAGIVGVGGVILATFLSRERIAFVAAGIGMVMIMMVSLIIIVSLWL